MGDAEGTTEHMAPLVGLVERLRAEVTELEERWETLGGELEAKRRRLKLAEATVELVEGRQEEKQTQGGLLLAGAELPARGGTLRAEEEECTSQSTQASVGCSMSRVHQEAVPDCDVSLVFDRLTLVLWPATSARIQRHRVIV
jgi:hypothetical protein